jgi:hypothetical protein
MANCKIILVLIVLIAAAEARKLCSPVVCPPFVWDLSQSINGLIKNGMTMDIDGSGLCPKGAVRYGSPSRCVCFPPSCTPDVKAVPQVCAAGESPQCPNGLPFFRDEPLGDWYKRMGAMFIENAVADGCCPDRHIKYYIDSEHTGVNKRLCYCDIPLDQYVVNEGLPDAFSLSSSDEALTL